MANDFSAEETDRWTVLRAERSVFIPWIEEQGYPLNHIKIQMWRPFLTGANRFATHCVLVTDIDKSGTYELNPVGEFAEDMLNFSEVLLDRGTPLCQRVCSTGWQSASSPSQVTHHFVPWLGGTSQTS